MDWPLRCSYTHVTALKLRNTLVNYVLKRIVNCANFTGGYCVLLDRRFTNSTCSTAVFAFKVEQCDTCVKLWFTDFDWFTAKGEKTGLFLNSAALVRMVHLSHTSRQSHILTSVTSGNKGAKRRFDLIVNVQCLHI